MDGVCVDFIGAAITAHGFDAQSILNRWRAEHPGSAYPEPLFDRSATEFFTHDDIQQAAFWSGLVPYPWYENLYAELSRLGHVVFLTAPTDSPGCVSGKHEWLNTRFGHGFHDFIFTRHKDRLAHESAFLIDDMNYNISPFNKRNGHGVLFPQIWNELCHITDPVPHVIEALEKRISISRSSQHL